MLNISTWIVTVYDQYLHTIYEAVLVPIINKMTIVGFYTSCIVGLGWCLTYLLKRRSVRAQEKRANIDQQLLEATTTAHTKIAESSEKISDALVQTIQQVSKGEEEMEQHKTEVTQGKQSQNFDLKHMHVSGTGNKIQININQPATVTGNYPSSTTGSNEVINPNQERELALAIEDNLEKNDFKRFLQKIGVKPQRINDSGRLADYAGNAIQKLKGKTSGSGNLQELLEAMSNDIEDPQVFAQEWLEVLFSNKR